jgi:hypothetical protein
VTFEVADDPGAMVAGAGAAADTVYTELVTVTGAVPTPEV